MEREVEVFADMRVEDDVLQYRCPTRTWRFAAEPGWRGTTSTWEPISELWEEVKSQLTQESAG